MEPRRHLIAQDKIRIQGAQTEMRVLRADEVSPRYGEWLNDPRVNAYSDRRFNTPYTQQDAVDYVGSMRRDELLLGVFLPDIGHVGNVKIGPIDWGNEAAEIAIMLGEPDGWGRGLGTEVMYGATRFLFDTIGLHRVDAGSFNPAFLKIVLEKLKWKIEGEQRERILVDGTYLSFFWVGLLRSEFERQSHLEPSTAE